MEDNCQNFIEQMRKRLNSYHIEKTKKIEEKQVNLDVYKQEKEAQNVLMHIDDLSLDHAEQTELNGFGEISGWISFNPLKPKQPSNVLAEKKEVSSRKNSLQCPPSRSLGTSVNCRMKSKDKNVNYYKEVLLRLQSPGAGNRNVKSSKVQSRCEMEVKKLKTQETLAQLRKASPSCNLRTVEQNDWGVRKEEKERVCDENRATFQSTKVQNCYQKIKRNKKIMDSENIINRRIRGVSQNYFTQKEVQKFSLKNLLC